MPTTIPAHTTIADLTNWVQTLKLSPSWHPITPTTIKLSIELILKDEKLRLEDFLSDMPEAWNLIATWLLKDIEDFWTNEARIFTDGLDQDRETRMDQAHELNHP